ncbi:acyltransferase family protein [Albimonas pacifica]|uniref:Peptidoglycan/LPS O-acetylase OafA/YrhL, contains acyltransferase and SGNH-hydrolase domains n=1 Tax=Albimonas pacifica TaxID=1114924 RepID=A0A1I3PRZ9_9RHOB|nr:acyltransferase family protein [Albimonas pacifica]SFJ24185.1 Peptidoglycan/LPS O-acetylase OafA/YrhL, contains acyltransferase and SGNH-hydrolase domains [Albimonas pacifica]
MIYRKEIDGLRTIAVGSVVLFHAGLPGFGGGFVGVDVFFVISGYLITAILLDDLDGGRFSILQFYERRARRILPALSLVIAVTSLVAVSGVMLPDQLTRYFQSVVATALFAANFFFWWSTDYFAPDAEESPLLHMWSLAVEEQFYLLFPIVLFLVWRWRKGWTAPLMLVCVLASLGLAEIASREAPTANFYFPVTRVWELLAGSLVAVRLRGGIPERTALSPWLAALGLALVLASIVMVGGDFRYPSLWTVPSVLGTALLIRYARPDDPAGWVLALAPMVFIGQLSYSIYLWHQPLLAFARISTFGHVELWVMLALSALTIPLSWLSWRFVEQPFRKGYSRRTIFSLSGVAIGAMIVVGAGIGTSERTAYAISRLTEEDRPVYDSLRALAHGTEEMTAPYRLASAGESCVFWTDRLSDELSRRIQDCAAQHGPGVMVTGGSHGIDLFYMLARNTEAPFLVGISRGFCRAHRSVEGAENPDCFFPRLPALVEARKDDIALFIYTQAAHSMFEDGRRLRDASGFHPELAEETAAYLRNIQADVPVLWLGPQRMLGDDVRGLAPDRDFATQLAQAYDPAIPQAETTAETEMKAAAEAAGIPFLSKWGMMEASLPDQAMLDGHLAYRDQDHLSPWGAEVFGARLVRNLAAAGYADRLPPRAEASGSAALPAD